MKKKKKKKRRKKNKKKSVNLKKGGFFFFIFFLANAKESIIFLLSVAFSFYKVFDRWIRIKIEDRAGCIKLRLGGVKDKFYASQAKSKIPIRKLLKILIE